MEKKRRGKFERNQEIKALFASGISQGQIAKQFGITQSRVSSIVHDRLPAYRYCLHCRARVESTALCSACREVNDKARSIRREERRREYEARQKRLVIVRAEQAERRAIKKEEEEKRTIDRFCHACSTLTTLSARSNNQGNIYCEKCRAIIGKMSGKDRTREIRRIMDKYTCQRCKRVWNGTERRFDAHHLNGLCGKKSRDYDAVTDVHGLTTLCHKCHMGIHGRTRNHQGLLFDRSKARTLRDKGLSYAQVAKLLDVSYAAIYIGLNKQD